MKKLISSLVLLLSPLASFATHQAQLTWTVSADSTVANPGTVNVYRVTGTCPAIGIGTANYTALTTSAAPAGPYTDSTIAVGTVYCYYVTATIGGVESAPSNTFQSNTVIPSAPTGLKVVVQ